MSGFKRRAGRNGLAFLEQRYHTYNAPTRREDNKTPCNIPHVLPASVSAVEVRVMQARSQSFQFFLDPARQIRTTMFCALSTQTYFSPRMSWDTWRAFELTERDDKERSEKVCAFAGETLQVHQGRSDVLSDLLSPMRWAAIITVLPTRWDISWITRNDFLVNKDDGCARWASSVRSDYIHHNFLFLNFGGKP